MPKEATPMRERANRAAAIIAAISMTAASLALTPSVARAADKDSTGDTAAADQLFGYSYGESAGSSGGSGAAGTSTGSTAADADNVRLKPGADSLELEFRGSDETQFFDTESRRGTKAHQFGIAGTGTGAGILGLGGLTFIGASLMDNGTKARDVTKTIGITAMCVGGALFITGAIFLIVDLSSEPPKHPIPAPTADGKGAQLIFTRRF